VAGDRAEAHEEYVNRIENGYNEQIMCKDLIKWVTLEIERVWSDNPRNAPEKL
jgi:hypothetical protein